MALFPKLLSESVVQVDDKTRLDASQSFVDKSEAALTSVEIEPEAAAGFVSVFDTNSKNWFLDYQYATDGAKVVTVRVDNGSGPVTATFTVTVVSAADDKLFSGDQDLFGIIEQKEILRLLEDGKSSFLNYHRKAQEEILDEIDAVGIHNNNGTKITKDQLVVSNDIKQWSIYSTLKHIYDDRSSSVGDKFDMRAQKYKSRADFYKERSIYRIDLNDDSSVTLGESVSVRSSRMVRV